MEKPTYFEMFGRRIDALGRAKVLEVAIGPLGDAWRVRAVILSDDGKRTTVFGYGETLADAQDDFVAGVERRFDVEAADVRE